MSSLIERFNAPLPGWTYEIKTETRQKIMKSQLIISCREWNKKAMETFLIRFWPFVNEYPKIIEKHKKNIARKETLCHPFSIGELNRQCKTIFKEIKHGEKNHRQLWLKTASALGLSETHLYYPWFYQNYQHPQALFRVQDIIDIVGAKTDSHKILLRLAAIEIIAECIGHELLIVFNDYGIEAIEWFSVHVYKKDGVMRREELLYRLAFTFLKNAPEKDKVNKIIQEVVDLFIKAGEIPLYRGI